MLHGLTSKSGFWNRPADKACEWPDSTHLDLAPRRMPGVMPAMRRRIHNIRPALLHHLANGVVIRCEPGCTH